MAKCHPDKPHYALGLCRSCYARKQYSENREQIQYRRRERHQERIEQEREYKRLWARKNYEGQRKYLLKRNFNMTLEEYDVLLEKQCNRCAICGKTPEENDRRLAVDHDHETGEVRGLLCRSCNLILGHAHDTINILARAIVYLEDSGEPPPPRYEEDKGDPHRLENLIRRS